MNLKVLALGNEEIIGSVAGALSARGLEVVSFPALTLKFPEVKSANYNLAVIDSGIADLQNLCFRLIWYCRLRVVVLNAGTARDWSEFKGLGVEAFISPDSEVVKVAADLEAIASQGSLVFPSLKVLVIEDDEHICESVRLCMRIFWQESEISFALDGQSGINSLKNLTPDIVLLDLGLPDISGFEVLSRIRAFSKLPVVILSATMDKEYIVKALKEGANDYVIKPFKQIELMSCLKKQVTPLLNRY